MVQLPKVIISKNGGQLKATEQFSKSYMYFYMYILN